MDDWRFLENTLSLLAQELPLIKKQINNLIINYYKEELHAKAFIPLRIFVDFTNEKEELIYNDTNMKNLWSYGWKRMFEHNKKYYSFLGFTDSQLSQLSMLEIENIEAVSRTLEGYGETTELVMEVTYTNKKYFFHFLKSINEDFISHAYVDSEFYFDNNQQRFRGTGKNFIEFFNLPKHNGYDFEKQWMDFLNQIHLLDFLISANTKNDTASPRNKNKIGLSIVSCEIHNSENIYLLSDGTYLKET